MNSNFEELFKILTLFEIKDKSEEVIKLLNEFFENLEKEKNENSDKFSKFTKFELICAQYLKGIEYIKNQNLKNELLMYPVIHILNYHKNRNISKIYIKALAVAFQRFLGKEEEEKDISIPLGNFIFKNINLIGIKELSTFVRPLSLEKSEFKLEIIEKIKTSIKICVKNKDKTILTTILSLIDRLKIDDEFDINELIKVSLHLNCVDIIVNIVKEHRNKSLDLMKYLNEKKHHKEMKIIILKHNLDFNNYPLLLDHQRYLFYKYLLKHFDFEKLEDRASNNKEDFLCLLKFLKNKKFLNERFSIYKRNKEKFGLNILELEDENKFEYIPNLLSLKNNFEPASIILKKESELEYIRLSDFNYKVEEVIWVDLKNIKKAIEKILVKKKVGIDCEFYVANCTNFSQTKLATFQLATNDLIFIFDCIGLIDSKDFCDFFVLLMENENILKIGHSFKGDIKVFEDTFKVKIKNSKNIVNIEKICGIKVISLANIAKHYLKKSLCKYEQMSSWQKRPLRNTQMHYGAIDAAIVLKLHDLIKNSSSKINIKNKKIKKINTQKEKLEEYLKTSNEENTVTKFLVDDMLEKLARKMRNCGFDTKFLKNCKRKEILQTAESENRIIITCSKEIYISRTKAIVFRIKTGKTDEQLIQIISIFGKHLKIEDIIKRCIMCNNDQFLDVGFDEVDFYFEKLDYKKPLEVSDFKVCKGCEQVFWQGGQYKKAKAQFAKLLIK